MTLTDLRGNAVSTGSRAALDLYDRALELFHGYFADPMVEIDAAITEDPGFVMGHCLKATLLATTTEKALLPALEESVAAAERLAPGANDRERGHVAALRAWTDGRLEDAVELWGRILFDHPRDSLALQAAHLGDFFLGQSQMLRDRVARVMGEWDADVPGYGYVLGMHAFGLEETQLYERAEEEGRRALSLGPRDPWAIHAVAHVMEMQGRLDDGIGWLEGRTDDWSLDNMFAFHNWWHLALYCLDLGRTERVLSLYDTRIRPKPTTVILETVDATALLWRLHLMGVDAGPRWAALAEAWEPMAEDAFYAFNDAHAMMAFTAAGRAGPARRLIAALERRALQGGSNAAMTRDVGLPVARAIDAFGRGDWQAVVDILLPVRTIAHRFGGSHAQRDLLGMTLIEAALRAGQGRLARALAAERLDLKPSSPFNWRATARALDLLHDERAADHAWSEAARLQH